MAETNGNGVHFGKRQQHELHRRDLLVLIFHHLQEEGLCEAANILKEQLSFDIEEYSVCDNLDLTLILMDFCGYFQMRFHRKPKLTKRNTGNHGGGKLTRGGRRGASTVPNINYPPKCRDEDTTAFLQVSAIGVDNVRTFEIPKELLQSEDTRELAQQISRDLFRPTAAADWSAVAGHDDVKRFLDECLLLPRRYPDLYAQCGLSHGTRGVLLCGPPGTGKTLLARTAAAQCGLCFLSLSASSLASKWRGDSERLVRAAFELARHNAPAVIYMDEVDALLGERGGATEHEASKRYKSEFLQQMDGLFGSEHSVLLLASTNAPWALDPAFLRRFQRVFYVGLPDPEDRLTMIRSSLRGVQTEKGLDLAQFVTASDACPGSEVVRAVELAKMGLFRRMVEQKGKKATVVMLNEGDLREAFDHITPGTTKWRCQYEEWKNNCRARVEDCAKKSS